MKVLAVAESDAYAKWAAWTLDSLPADWERSLVVIDTPIRPSATQLEAALSGTSWAGSPVEVVRSLSFCRQLRRSRPEIVVLACTGPTIAFLSVLARLIVPDVVVVAGLPGVALPVRDRAIDARRLLDVFIAHSRRERREFERAFAHSGADRPVVALATLPFLHRPAGIGESGGERVVFAAQPTVPPEAQDRREILRWLARCAPPAPMMKLRVTEPGEAATHYEAHPYPALWADLVAEGLVDHDAVEFVGGSFTDVLADASLVASISSTALLEAVGAGIPILVLEDFGTSDELLNSLFEGSGALGTMCTPPEGVIPRPEWIDDNYWHHPGENDLVDLLRDVPPVGRRWTAAGHTGFVRALARGAVRVVAPRLSRRMRRRRAGS